MALSESGLRSQGVIVCGSVTSSGSKSPKMSGASASTRKVIGMYTRPKSIKVGRRTK